MSLISNQIIFKYMSVNGRKRRKEKEGKIGNVSSNRRDAIVSFENKNYVFVAKANKQFEMKEVIVGNTENNYTQISTAELQNAKIVIKGAYALLMKLKNVE